MRDESFQRLRFEKKFCLNQHDFGWNQRLDGNLLGVMNSNDRQPRPYLLKTGEGVVGFDAS